jgi:class 3 adenylate cyclase
MDIEVNENALEEALGAIEQVRTWSPRVVSRLEHFIRTAPDEGLFRLNPLQWATERGVDEYEAVDLFLHSAKVGLFDMDWNVICPCCGKVMRSLRELHGLQSENTCTVCFRRDDATLDDFVQVTFTISPTVRRIRHHDPETLALEDYLFEYLYEPSVRIGGFLTPRDSMRMFFRHLAPFHPGENVTVETDLEPGILSCVDAFSQPSFGLLAQGEPDPETRHIKAMLTETGFDVPLPPMDPGEFDLGPFSYAGTFYPMRPGRVAIEFEQRSAAEAALMVIYFPVFGLPNGLTLPDGSNTGPIDTSSLDPSGGLVAVGFESPRLTAKRLFATQTFHELFRAEVFQESEGFSVKDVTVLFTDLKGSTQLYQREGDLNAYALVRQHYGILSHCVTRQHGAVVKTIGDAIMATFEHPAEAVAAGLDMLRELPGMNQSSTHGDLVLKVGIHHGAAISVTLNDQVDYFGQTVNIASRVQGSADGNQMLLTGEMLAADGVRELLDASGCTVEAAEVALRGIEERLEVYRVSAPGP